MPLTEILKKESVYQEKPAVGYWESQLEKGIRPYIKSLVEFACPKGSDILELGCGSGRNLLGLRGLGYQAFGVDLVLESLTVGLRAPSHIPFGLTQGRAQNLPFANQSFDVVLLTQDFLSIFHDSKTRNHILLEARRVTKKEGHLIVSITNSKFAPTLRSFIFYLYTRILLYSKPQFNLKKLKEIYLRMGQYLKTHWQVIRHSDLRKNRDVYLEGPFLGKTVKRVPYHLSNFREFENLFGHCSLKVKICKAYIEFLHPITLPMWVRKGSPYLAYLLERND